MKKIVLVNIDFIDAYTGKLHTSGSRVEMTAERIAEVKAVNPEFVSIVGNVEEATEAQTEEKPKRKKAE